MTYCSMYVHTHAHTRSHARTHRHTYLHTHKHTQTHTNTHKHTHTHLHTHTHTHKHTHAHTHTHTNTNTHIIPLTGSFMRIWLKPGLENVQISRIVVSQLISLLQPFATVQGPNRTLGSRTNLSVAIRRKKHRNLDTNPLGLLCPIIRGRKQSYEESATNGKIALAI